MSVYTVSHHAVERYRSRVEDVTEPVARHAIEDLLTDARLRPTPRHWMRQRTSYGSGVRFGYSPRAPEIALVLRSATVATVLTRSMFRPTTERPNGLAPVTRQCRMEGEAA
jgi:hypothetical protein